MATSIGREIEWTAGDLMEQFGAIPLSRIRHDPRPGTATEADVIEIHDREDRLYELIDGVLVEKRSGLQESYLAVVISGMIGNFVADQDLGIVLGADGMARLAPGLVRIPDVSFVSWDRLGGRQVPADAMLDCGPNLAVEVLSPSNTRKEMDRKLKDYFDADVELVWFVDPGSRSAQVFTAPAKPITVTEQQLLEGGTVLPGFTLSLADLFQKLKSAGK